MFLFLLCGGTLTYVYILWSTYWQQMSKYSYEDSLHHHRSSDQHHKPRLNFRNVAPNHPDQPSFQKEAKIEKSEMDLPMDKLLLHVKHYKTQIVSQLRSAVIATGKSVLNGEVKN